MSAASTALDSELEDDVEIEPLSGNPFFHMLMRKSHITSPSQLIIPAKFTTILPCKPIPAILLRGTMSWEMIYYGNRSTHRRFGARWRTFVEDNELKIGDICVFELISSQDTFITFKVQLLRGDFPSVLLDRLDGTPNNPIVIDDD